MSLFVRIGSHPSRDLRRRYSYSMGAFGEPGQAHAGLSGYSLDSGWEYALEKLESYMGIYGEYSIASSGLPSKMFLTVFEGTNVGVGPDLEDLFRPSRIVFSIDTRRAKSAEDMIDMVIRRLRKRGFSELRS